ncbi:hypothetical protein C1Y63_06145 [Corynebacterium sp. 13CS0277]|uniref:hypothetical protein n=1 Tax=Corynebacterium sp. 13CS0277 TaxID=2071994 RepID=UPI000D0474A0|nr:hypothetical protein [Corynebacterium sp. 13CS0277]PRQ11428.1 hypothetical protein C1Y63_06145 [Corynebacterium sp. 13CS0277]
MADFTWSLDDPVDYAINPVYEELLRERMQGNFTAHDAITYSNNRETISGGYIHEWYYEVPEGGYGHAKLSDELKAVYQEQLPYIVRSDAIPAQDWRSDDVLIALGDGRERRLMPPDQIAGAMEQIDAAYENFPWDEVTAEDRLEMVARLHAMLTEVHPFSVWSRVAVEDTMTVIAERHGVNVRTDPGGQSYAEDVHKARALQNAEQTILRAESYDPQPMLEVYKRFHSREPEDTRIEEATARAVTDAEWHQVNTCEEIVTDDARLALPLHIDIDLDSLVWRDVDFPSFDEFTAPRTQVAHAAPFVFQTIVETDPALHDNGVSLMVFDTGSGYVATSTEWDADPWLADVFGAEKWEAFVRARGQEFSTPASDFAAPGTLNFGDARTVDPSWEEAYVIDEDAPMLTDWSPADFETPNAPAAEGENAPLAAVVADVDADEYSDFDEVVADADDEDVL